MPNADFVVTEWVSVPTDQGGMPSFLARPFKDTQYPGPRLDLSYQVRAHGDERFPALVIAFEVYGLADAMHNVCWRLGHEGYVAVAPDLYWHDPAWQEIDTWDVERARASFRTNDPEVIEKALLSLAPDHQPRARKALAWLQGHDNSTYIPDLEASLDYLKSRPDVDPERVAIMGFCMGGGLAGNIAAQRDDLAATVIYYGAPPRNEIVPDVACPILAHYGSLDDLARRAPDFEKAMTEHKKEYELYIYEGAPHRFFNDTRPFYQAEPARLSWERTLAFLRKHVGDK